MKNTKIGIVSSGKPLMSILTAIDLEEIDICKLFGMWNEIEDSMKKEFKPIFQPLDMLYINCNNCDAEYFLVNLSPNLSNNS